VRVYRLPSDSCLGCTNPSFTEYSATATVDDNSCQTRRDATELLSGGKTRGSREARDYRKDLLNTAMRSKTRPASQSRKDFVKESRFELTKDDLSNFTKSRLTEKSINKVFHSMGPRNKDNSPNCTNGDCCHIDFSDQNATDLQVIEPDLDIGSWVVACNGVTPQCMQTRTGVDQYDMQNYDNGWGTALLVRSDKVYQCGSNLVVIGSMAGECVSSVHCNGGECFSDDGTYTCINCPTDKCGDICEFDVDDCGLCNGPGAIYDCGCQSIPVDTCDCDGNVADCAGVCGGNAVDEGCGCGQVCGPSTCPSNTTGLTAAEYINAQCCQC